MGVVGKNLSISFQAREQETSLYEAALLLLAINILDRASLWGLPDFYN